MKALALTLPFLGLTAALADQIGIDDLASRATAPIVVLGEVHDNPIHHSHQAQGVKGVQPAALVFEMLTPGQADIANTPDLRSDQAALGNALAWETSGWPDFAMYYPIFAAAPNARVYGAAVPREEARGAFSEGAAAVFGDGADRFGLTTPLTPADQAEREAEQQEAHCNAMPPDLLPGLVSAQRLRDARLAQVAEQAFADTGGPVVVITGNGHARLDRGLPAALATARPDLTVYSLGQLEDAPDTPPPFTDWIVTDPTPRDDPCAAFDKG